MIHESILLKQKMLEAHLKHLARSPSLFPAVWTAA